VKKLVVYIFSYYGQSAYSEKVVHIDQVFERGCKVSRKLRQACYLCHRKAASYGYHEAVQVQLHLFLWFAVYVCQYVVRGTLARLNRRFHQCRHRGLALILFIIAVVTDGINIGTVHSLHVIVYFYPSPAVGFKPQICSEGIALNSTVPYQDCGLNYIPGLKRKASLECSFMPGIPTSHWYARKSF